MRTEIGAKVRLIRMEDPYPVPTGSIGTVTGIDCNGDLEIAWACGSILKLIPDVDEWEVLPPAEEWRETHEEGHAVSTIPDSDNRPSRGI